MNKEGEFSAPSALVAESGQLIETLLDFRTSSTIKGLVYDGVFAQRLEGARISISTLNGIALHQFHNATSGKINLNEVLTDRDGHFELRTVEAAEGAVLVRREGFADSIFEIHGESIEGVIDLGNIPLKPVESIEVRLTGLSTADPTAYKIREGWESEPVSFDESATAWLTLPKAVPDLSLVLFTPDGVNLRLDLHGMALDHDPLVIDLSNQVEVTVVVDDWQDDFSARNLNLSVVSIDGSGLRRFSSAELDGPRVSAYAWGAGPAIATVVEVDPEVDRFLAASSVPIAHTSPAPIHVSIGLSGGWQFVDEAGRPLSNALIYAMLHGHASRFSMALVADELGRVDVPLGIDGEYLLNMHLPDGTLLTDMSIEGPTEPGSFQRVEIPPASVYDVKLSSSGSPLPWHRVSICSELPVDLGVLTMSNADGELSSLRFRGGSRPRVVIHDPRLFEFGQSYPIRPGMNQIEVRRTGVLVIELGPTQSAETLVVGDAEFAGWLASGKVRRDISLVGGVTQVRFSPVPLGEYSCTLAGVASGPLTVSRAGATATHRL